LPSKDRPVSSLTPPRHDVFLSHASPDKDWVRTLRDELEKRGLRVEGQALGNLGTAFAPT
jgi:hypothetical protein